MDKWAYMENSKVYFVFITRTIRTAQFYRLRWTKIRIGSNCIAENAQVLVAYRFAICTPGFAHLRCATELRSTEKISINVSFSGLNCTKWLFDAALKRVEQVKEARSFASKCKIKKHKVEFSRGIWNWIKENYFDTKLKIQVVWVIRVK